MAEILSRTTEVGVRARHFVLESANTCQKSGSVRTLDTHLTSDAIF